MARYQNFRGQGKLLLSGEYFVMDGAKALALPTTVGQSLTVRYKASYSPFLHWRSYDYEKKIWLQAKFEFWHFDLVETSETPEILMLQKILRQARKLNTHFLRDEEEVWVEAHLEFPRQWGLGSSSSLLSCIGEWAYVSSYDLLQATTGGSGYDVALALAKGPLCYQKNEKGIISQPISFSPHFKEHLSFVYLGKKQSTSEGIAKYLEICKRKSPAAAILEITRLTEEMLVCTNHGEFNSLLRAHEKVVSEFIEIPPIKSLFFSDFCGEVKSLGAWGGDFALISSDRSFKEVRDYFQLRGYETILPYVEIIQEEASLTQQKIELAKNL